MDKVKLAEHVKRGDTFYTPFTDPNGVGAALRLSSWAKSWLPEFLWIGLIIHKQGRKQGLKSLYSIIKELKASDITIPQFSKISNLEKSKQELFWNIVTRYVENDILAPISVVITPDINEVFYNRFFDFMCNIDDSISELLNIIRECERFHDELSTDICFIVDWFYIMDDRLHISSELDMLPTALTEYYNHFHDDEVMKMYRPMIRSTFQGLCNLDCSKAFSECFWRILGKISECNPLKVIWEKNESMDFFEMTTRIMEYFSASVVSNKL